jgi:hypothetical protein
MRGIDVVAVSFILRSDKLTACRGQGKNFAGLVPRSGHRRVEMASARAERSFV